MSVKNLLIPFRVLTLTGAWCPDHWPKTLKVIYKCYSFMAVAALLNLNVCQIARLLFVKSDNFEEFNDTFNVTLSVNAMNFKLVGTLLHHGGIVSIIKMLEKTCCCARDEIERNIREDYDTLARKIFRRAQGFVGFLGVLHVLVPLNGGIERRELPFNVLVPYNLTNPTNYALTYAQHCFVSVFVGGMSISVDLLIMGFLLDLCCQCEILKYRIHQLPHKVIEARSKLKIPISYDRYLIRDIVQHHVHLYNIGKAVARTFGDIIIYQFYVDAIEIGVTVYQSSLGTSNAERQIFFVLYIGCMLGQLFLNCYFGNEVSLESKSIGNAIYNCDWTDLPIQWKKDLLIIMRQSSKAIEISTRAFVHLMLETFVKIVKVSYSGFNILKTSA